MAEQNTERGTGQKCGSCEWAKLSCKEWAESLSVAGSATWGQRAENGGVGMGSYLCNGLGLGEGGLGMEPCYHTSANTQNQYTMVSRVITGLTWWDNVL